MPIHEYNCHNCGHSFEVLVTGKAAPEVQCPACASPGGERLIGLPVARQKDNQKPATNCRGDGPPCGNSWCGRKGL
jgi:putative FmdB family regulatory protein